MISEFISQGIEWRSGYECALYDILDYPGGESVPKEAIRNLMANLEAAEKEE